MRFLIDMPLSPQLARWLSGLGHDCVHAANVGLSGAPDSLIIEQARKDKRVVITADLDFPRILALAGIDSPGLIHPD